MTNPHSLKGIFDVIVAKLPEALRPFCYFGLRNVPQFAGRKRIICVPVMDTFGPAARQGDKNPEQIFSCSAGCDVYMEAPTHEEIEGKDGLRDLFLSACYPMLQGSFAVGNGAWAPIDAQSVRGERYVLNVVFKRPVLRAAHTDQVIESTEIEQDVNS